MSKDKIVGYRQASFVMGMGENAISYNELINFLDHWDFYKEPIGLNSLRYKRFCIEMLHNYKETHYLIPVPPLSLLSLSFKCRALELSFPGQNLLLDIEDLTARDSCSWFLVRKNPIVVNTIQIAQWQRGDTSAIKLEGKEVVANARVTAFTELLVRHNKKTSFLCNEDKLFFPIENMTLKKLSSKIILEDSRDVFDENETALVPTMIRII